MQGKQELEKEEILWQALKSGDEEGFELLFKKHHDFLLAFGLTVHFDRGVVKDGIQEVFLDLWRRGSSLPDVIDQRGYLCQILKRTILRSLKRSRTAQQLRPGFEGGALPFEALIIEKQQNEETRIRLTKALQQLTLKQREIIQLRFFEDLSYLEIAEKNGTKKQTIYNQVHAALKKLKELMLLHSFLFLP